VHSPNPEHLTNTLKTLPSLSGLRPPLEQAYHFRMSDMLRLIVRDSIVIMAKALKGAILWNLT
jgi:hypothetical protein